MKQIDNIRHPRVLVVDDNAADRLLACTALELADFTVIEAEGGAQALAVFEQTRPDLVLLDVKMPNLDGYATCLRLRNLPRGNTVPVLMATGLNGAEAIDRAYEVGADDFVTKPIDWTLLSYRVRHMLRTNRLMDELAKSQSSLANAQRLACLGNWDWDLETGHVHWSDEVYRMLGVTPGSIPATLASFLQVTHSEDQKLAKASIIETLRTGKPTGINFRLVRADGSERMAYEKTEAVLDGQGRIIRLTGTVQDITERKQAEEQIRYMAYFDSLTKLPNRRFFKDHARQALKLARRYGRLMAVLFLDLDDFKRINDTLSHSVGDLLLEAVASRLCTTLRSSDSVTCDDSRADDSHVARFGGDEFMVLLSEIHHIEDAVKVARRILETLSQPLILAGHNVFVTPSIGIAVFPNDGDDVDSLIKNADTAMYHAKKAGKNAYQFYDESMNKAATERLALENELRGALERDELFLVYQPQMDLMNGAIVGVEALLRWHNPRLGGVSPAEFIPLAEEIGLIIPIGAWVLRTACAQAKAWQEQGLPALRVSVNLSTRQFMQRDLVESIAQILRETGLPAQYLELEITESLLMQDVKQAIRTMDALKNMGVQLTIDDFGTGYSSLNYLKRFPIDRLKIDRSFVQDITSDPSNAAIALAVVSMAHSLKLRVVAEGVETAAQQAFLKRKLCDEMQGYYLSRPLPPQEVAALLQNHRVTGWDDGDEETGRHTLLLVDDEVNVTTALSRILRREGYRVLTALGARQALELLATNQVSVVISDQAMPEMNGTEFLRRVRDLYPDTVRILLSGRSNMTTLIDAINEGAIYKFLAKPVAKETLLTTLREAFLICSGQRVQGQQQRVAQYVQCSPPNLASRNGELYDFARMNPYASDIGE